MEELNPNHPVTIEMHDQWHKLLAIVMVKFGKTEVLIHVDDIARFSDLMGPGAAVTVHPKGNVIALRIVNGEEAERLAREAGGLPT